MKQTADERARRVEKSYLQKIFSQEVRFSGFTQDWKVKRFSELVNYESSKHTTIQLEEAKAGKYSIYDANQEIAKINSYDQDNAYISIIKDGAGIGRIDLKPERSSIIGTMGYIIPKENNLEFIYALLFTLNFFAYQSGSTIPHIYFKDYGEAKFLVPLNLNEQKFIGFFFKTLDTKISLAEEKLSALNQLKKVFLQKMFI